MESKNKDQFDGLNLGDNVSVVHIKTFESNNLFIICEHDSTTMREIFTKCLNNYEHSAFKNPYFYSEELKKTIFKDKDLNKTMKKLKLSRRTSLKLVRTINEVAKSEHDTNKNVERIQELKRIGGYPINVISLTGHMMTIDVASYFTVEDLKYLMQDKTGIPTDQQRLIHRGYLMGNSDHLADYGIERNSTIHLVLSLRGGMYHETSGRDGNYQKLENKTILVLGSVAVNFEKV